MTHANLFRRVSFSVAASLLSRLSWACKLCGLVPVGGEGNSVSSFALIDLITCKLSFSVWHSVVADTESSRLNLQISRIISFSIVQDFHLTAFTRENFGVV